MLSVQHSRPESLVEVTVQPWSVGSLLGVPFETSLPQSPGIQTPDFDLRRFSHDQLPLTFRCDLYEGVDLALEKTRYSGVFVSLFGGGQSFSLVGAEWRTPSGALLLLCLCACVACSSQSI